MLCVSMTDVQTTCKDVLGSGEEKKFTFDYSFWSHDGYGTREDGYTYPLNYGKDIKTKFMCLTRLARACSTMHGKATTPACLPTDRLALASLIL